MCVLYDRLIGERLIINEVNYISKLKLLCLRLSKALVNKKYFVNTTSRSFQSTTTFTPVATTADGLHSCLKLSSACIDKQKWIENCVHIEIPRKDMISCLVINHFTATHFAYCTALNICSVKYYNIYNFLVVF